MTDMNNQYPGYTPPPEDGWDEAREEVRDNNRTLTTIATVLGVLLLIAAIIIGWMWATRDDDDSTSAADTTTTSTTPLTTPVETVTATSTEPDPVTVTNTVPVEETTQTITQQTTAAPPAPPTTTAPAPGPSCDPEAFRADGHDFVDGLLFCESGWARGGQDQTDYVRIFQWVNESWEMYAPTGESATTGYPCYDTDAMAAQGAPAALINQTLACSDG